MITTSELKARVEKDVGTEICPAFFQYGDEYLVLLTADTVREMAFSEYALMQRNLFG